MKEYIEPEGPYEVPEVQKSTRVKFQRRQCDVLRTIGSKYAVAVPYLEDHGELHMYAHMLFITNISKITTRRHNSDYKRTVAHDRIQIVRN